jgi:hypothetical protein
MSRHNKAIWAFLHIIAIVTVFVCLLTGLRIAVLDRPYLLHVSGLLPQGEMHSVHLLSATLFTLCVLSYLVHRLMGRMYVLAKIKTRNTSIRFHTALTRFLYVVCIFSVASGWLLFSDTLVGSNTTVLLIHYVSALLLLFYVIVHGGAWFIEFGARAFSRMFNPFKTTRQVYATVFTVLLLVPVSWGLLLQSTHHTLEVKQIDQRHYIEIDGRIDDTIWKEAKPITLSTHGGANFKDGSTSITLRALQNGAELFMYIEWQDETQSLAHLPLIKTENGWQIQQQGFHEFNETKYYEDKLAIMLSDNCEFAGAGTAHLGPKPLKDKPAHWTGQGYHYTTGSPVDLWHWKAVRTNHMRLMDDNFIGKPDILRHGSRRYTAGYKTDARESGAYKENWTWYSDQYVEPKRLPLNREWLAPYQADGNIQEAEIPWIMTWFDGKPYTKEHDDLPVGTVLPSILYTSNQFEGDRANVRAYATWNEGTWSLELFRKLDTQSESDVAIKDGTCLWIAAFDQAQIAHTRHVRPIQLRFHQ